MAFEKSGLQVHTNPHIFNQLVQFGKPIQGPGGNVSPIWRLAPNLSLCDPDHAFGFFDDFLTYTTAHEGWAATVEDTGSIQSVDGVGGLITLTPDADEDDEAYLTRENQTFMLSAGKVIYFEAMITVTEVATNVANIILQLSDAAAANSLVDTGAGPPADYDGISIFKVDGGVVWQAEVSNGASQTTDTDIYDVTTGTAIRLGFVATPTQVDFYANNQKVASLTSNIPAASEMKVRLGVKCGGDGIDVLGVDWVKCIQIR